MMMLIMLRIDQRVIEPQPPQDKDEKRCLCFGSKKVEERDDRGWWVICDWSTCELLSLFSFCCNHIYPFSLSFFFSFSDHPFPIATSDQPRWLVVFSCGCCCCCCCSITTTFQYRDYVLLMKKQQQQQRRLKLMKLLKLVVVLFINIFLFQERWREKWKEA